MKELRNIIQAFYSAQKAGMQTALATVVHVEGSSYRRPGARMLVTENGSFTGAISGGCLEGDALRKAQYAMVHGINKLVTYDTTDDDDAKLGVGLGCQGIIHILIEPIDTSHPDHPVALLQQVVEQSEHSALVTLFSLQNRQGVQPGTCLLRLQNGTVAGSPPDVAFRNELMKHMEEALAEGRSLLQEYMKEGSLYTAFIGVVPPAISLVIAGAGNDAVPLAQMAHLMGWQVTVIDGRHHYATAERFPMAHRLIVARPEHVPDQVMPDRRTYFVLMTHSYAYDLAMLRWLLPLGPPYIGVLGPRTKLDRMLTELQHERINTNDMSNLYGPVGLDIGAEFPEEIALAIVAEIRAVITGRPARSLRTSKTVHPR